jgi:hypothetical protein
MRCRDRAAIRCDVRAAEDRVHARLCEMDALMLEAAVSAAIAMRSTSDRELQLSAPPVVDSARTTNLTNRSEQKGAASAEDARRRRLMDGVTRCALCEGRASEGECVEKMAGCGNRECVNRSYRLSSRPLHFRQRSGHLRCERIQCILLLVFRRSESRCLRRCDGCGIVRVELLLRVVLHDLLVDQIAQILLRRLQVFEVVTRVVEVRATRLVVLAVELLEVRMCERLLHGESRLRIEEKKLVEQIARECGGVRVELTKGNLRLARQC